MGVWLGGRNSIKQARLVLNGQREDKDRRERLSRLEELYALVEQWSKNIISYHVVYRAVMQNQFTYDEANDVIIGRGGSGNDTNRMSALAELYFVEYRDTYEVMMAARDKAAEIQTLYKDDYIIHGPDSRDRSSELTEALSELSESISTYKAVLSRGATVV